MMTPKTRNFTNIELVRAGTWSSRNGKVTITEEDLADAVLAYGDEEVDHGKLKFGHVSSLNNDLGDGAPSIGWIENLRLSDDKKALFGDIIDVPEKVASLFGTAYRQRSIEMRRNVETPSGKTYKSAVTGLALLGASAPAVKGMEDLFALYASENPNGIDDEATETEIVSIELSDTTESNETDQKEKPTMAFLDEARTTLGLSEGATEEEILEALKTKTATEETPSEEEAPATEEVVAESTEEETPAEQDKTEEVVETSAEAPKTITLSESVYAEEQAELAKFRAEKAERQRKETIDLALSEGKITPAERGTWEVALSADFDTTSTLLSNLSPRVNVSETGSEVALSATEDTDEEALANLAAKFGI